MDREQEEVVLRCTAHYIEALQAGHQPEISDYLARYPQYADAIANFIAYYQTVELPQAQPIESMDNTDSLHSADEFTSEFHIAIESAWQRVLMPGTTPEHMNRNMEDLGKATQVPEPEKIAESGKQEKPEVMGEVVYGQTIQSLFLAAKQQQLSPSQLATRLTISEDILLLLEQQALLLESIPQELYGRLAKTLHQPERAVRAYLGLQRRQQVAEHPAIYDTGNSGNARDTTRSTQKVSFREVIDKSEKLSAEQKKFWRDVLTKDEL
jgi:hypothetical protein